ncbi:hypothetical protein BKA66DRAFT_447176 [Pyrenochaeta sp. MPI-SDFR-AT-0127]|nr:hypothetical protein BKA66DRAFT_447176 [Pyrenochaeta sp. MPI-SDFR-AT-0127]
MLNGFTQDELSAAVCLNAMQALCQLGLFCAAHSQGVNEATLCNQDEAKHEKLGLCGAAHYSALAFHAIDHLPAQLSHRVEVWRDHVTYAQHHDIPSNLLPPSRKNFSRPPLLRRHQLVAPAWEKSIVVPLQRPKARRTAKSNHPQEEMERSVERKQAEGTVRS